MKREIKKVQELFREMNRNKNKYFRKLRAAALCKILAIAPSATKSLPQGFCPKTIVFLITDNKLGDMLAATSLFREAKKLYPHSKIYVVAGRTPLSLLENNPYVDKGFVFSRNFLSMYFLGNKLNKLKIDLLIDVDDLPLAQTFLLIKTIAPKFLIGFDREKYNFYTISIPARLEHITLRHRAVISLLDSTLGTQRDFDDTYDLFLDPKSLDNAKTFFSTLPDKEIYVINVFSGSHKRDLSFEQVSEIATHFKGKTFILVGSPSELKRVPPALPKNVVVPSYSANDSISFYCALIKLSHGLISPDTFAVHVADAFLKKVFVFYRLDGNDFWLPKHTSYFKFASGEDKLKETKTDKIISALETFFKQ